MENPKRWIEERHAYWWNFLLKMEQVPSTFDASLPEIEWTGKISRQVAGKASKTSCQYVLAYLLQEEEGYDVVIIHDVCHVFAIRCSQYGHCAYWFHLCNDVCGSIQEQKHSYLKPTAKSLRLKFKEAKNDSFPTPRLG